jgi:hypothetical protein
MGVKLVSYRKHIDCWGVQEQGAEEGIWIRGMDKTGMVYLLR